jgi:hypothetical protein
MRTIHFDDGTRWDDPNARWGDPSYLLEPGDPGYVAPVPINQPQKRRKHMTRNSYYPTRSNTGLAMAVASVRLSNIIRYAANFVPQPTFAPDDGTAALYDFAEQTGTTAADSSGNGNNLTLTALPGGTLPVWFVE